MVDYGEYDWEQRREASVLVRCGRKKVPTAFRHNAIDVIGSPLPRLSSLKGGENVPRGKGQIDSAFHEKRTGGRTYENLRGETIETELNM